RQIAADHAILVHPAIGAPGDGNIVEKAIAEIGVLGPFVDQQIEDVGVQRPATETLAGSKTEQAVDGARAGLELGLELLAATSARVGAAGGQFHAGNHRELQAPVLLIEKAPLTEQSQIAQTLRIAERFDMRRLSLLVDVAVDDAMASDPWKAQRYGEVRRHAIGDAQRSVD